jgi:type I restriction enzyme R subunit
MPTTRIPSGLPPLQVTSGISPVALRRWGLRLAQRGGSVTPSARVKDRFIIVDAIGVCEQDKTDSHTLNRHPSKTLEEVLNYVAQGGTEPDALVTLAGRLARLQRDFDADQLAELKTLAGGESFPDLAHDLLNACDPDAQRDAARDQFQITGDPTEDQLRAAGERLAQEAVTPFLKAAFRRRILEIRQQNEHTVDRHTIDDVLYSGFDASAVDKARTRIQDFRGWIDAHKDELTALQVLYEGTRPLKLSLKDLRQLRDALARPPLAATPEQIWRAYQAVEADKVKRTGGSVLTDLVSLVRHALRPSSILMPYPEELLERYNAWLHGTHAAREIHTRATSVAQPHRQPYRNQPRHRSGGFRRRVVRPAREFEPRHQLFGDRLTPLIEELNARLAA